MYHVVTGGLRSRGGWRGYIIGAEPAGPDQVRHGRACAVSVLHWLHRRVRVRPRRVSRVVKQRGRALGRFFQQIFLQNLDQVQQKS